MTAASLVGYKSLDLESKVANRALAAVTMPAIDLSIPAPIRGLPDVHLLSARELRGAVTKSMVQNIAMACLGWSRAILPVNDEHNSVGGNHRTTGTGAGTRKVYVSAAYSSSVCHDTYSGSS